MLEFISLSAATARMLRERTELFYKMPCGCILLHEDFIGKDGNRGWKARSFCDAHREFLNKNGERRIYTRVEVMKCGCYKVESVDTSRFYILRCPRHTKGVVLYGEVRKEFAKWPKK